MGPTYGHLPSREQLFYVLPSADLSEHYELVENLLDLESESESKTRNALEHVPHVSFPHPRPSRAPDRVRVPLLAVFRISKAIILLFYKLAAGCHGLPRSRGEPGTISDGYLDRRLVATLLPPANNLFFIHDGDDGDDLRAGSIGNVGQTSSIFPFFIAIAGVTNA